MDHLKEKIKEQAMLMFILLVLALTIVITLLFMYDDKTTKHEEALAQIESLNRDLEAKNGEISALNTTKEALIAQIAKSAVEQDTKIAELNDTIEALQKNSFELPDYVVSSLSNHGYNEPKLLLETLTEQNDIIPVEGVLGGTMRWWPEASMILTEKYAFGNFEDGHILGYALLEYTFDDEDNVKWRILNYYMD